ncbi:MAG: hypothetical protein NDJ89_11095 [Oligoflexia bacterium]|nr:hypothetical protein [Oligoflexia bacterium]
MANRDPALTPDVPTHLEENRRYSGDWKTLYGPFGLFPVEAFGLWMPLILRKALEAPRIPFTRRLKIGLMQVALLLARWWNGPLILLADRARRKAT